MPSSAIISYLWEKHLGALDDFLATFPVDAVVVPGAHLNARLHEIAAARGCDVVRLEDLLPADYPRGRTSRKALVSLRDHLDGSAWAPSDLADGSGEVDRLRALVRHRVDVDVPAAVQLLDALAAARAAYDLRLFVTSEDVTPPSKVAAAWARARRVPSLHVAHSLALIDPYTVHAELLTDVLAVYGERGAEGYLDLGIDPDRIVVTGNPAWDGYATMRQQRAALRAELVGKHGLDPDLPIVVFGTTWSARLTALDTGDSHHRTLAAFVAACVELERQDVRFTAVVKDRPSNAAFGEETLLGMLAESGVRRRVLHTVDDGPGWAVAADVLVAVDSNYLVEAMLAGTPTVNLAGTAMLPVPPVFDGASGVVEAEPAALAPRLRELLEDPALRNRRLAQTAARLEHYHRGGADGGAARRVADVMVRLAGSAARERPPLRQRLGQRLRHAVHVGVGQVREER
jgi:hypothetical protein